MLAYRRIYAGVLGLSALLFLAGCQTTPAPVPRSALVQTPQGLLTCRDCKVSTVQEPVTDPKGRLVGHRPRTVMTCPDCNDVEEVVGMGEATYVKRHTCVTCADSIVICSMH